MTNLTISLRSFVQRYGTSDSQGGGQDVGSFDSGRWVAFSNQDLGGGVLRLRLRATGDFAATVTLRTGSVTGNLFCTLNYPAGGGWSTWVTRETTCAGGASGVQTLFLIFTFPNGANIAANWIELDLGGSVPPTATPPPNPTATPLPTPTPIPPSVATWRRVEAESFTSASQGVIRVNTGDPNGGVQDVGNFDIGRWLAFPNQNILVGVVRMRLRADSPNIGTLRLRVGSPTGTILCTLSWISTSTYASTDVVMCDLSAAYSGIQTLYLVNETVQWININWFELEFLPSPVCTAPSSPGFTTFSNNCVPNQLAVQFFQGPDLQGPAWATGTWGSSINVNWGTASPGYGILPSGYSVRWIGMVSSQCPGATASPTFYVRASDGFRLYVDGILAIDQWSGTALQYYTYGPVSMQTSLGYEFRLEYRYRGAGNSQIEVSWTNSCGDIVPGLVTISAFSYPLSYPGPLDAYIDPCVSIIGALPGTFGLTTHRLRGMAFQMGMTNSTNRSSRGVNGRVGRAFEKWAIEQLQQDIQYVFAMPFFKNNDPFESPLRRTQTRGAHRNVVPDVVIPLQITPPAQLPISFPNSTWFEMKAVDGIINLSTNEWQVSGFIDAMAQPQNNVAAYGATVVGEPIHPEINFITTVNTQIGNAVTTAATNGQVYMRQMFACEVPVPGGSGLFLGIMRNLNMEVYDGTDYLYFWLTRPPTPLRLTMLDMTDPPVDPNDPDPAEVQ